MKSKSNDSLQDILSRRPKWILSSGFYFIFIILLGVVYFLSDRGLPVLDFFKKSITIERNASTQFRKPSSPDCATVDLEQAHSLFFRDDQVPGSRVRKQSVHFREGNFMYLTFNG